MCARAKGAHCLAICIVTALAASVAIAALRWASLGGTFNDTVWCQRRIELTISDAEEIARALHRYRVDYGKYPRQLEELTPTYMAEIPSPSVGSAWWDYRTTSQRRKFCITFRANGGYPLYDLSSDGMWSMDSG